MIVLHREKISVVEPEPESEPEPPEPPFLAGAGAGVGAVFFMALAFELKCNEKNHIFQMNFTLF